MNLTSAVALAALGLFAARDRELSALVDDSRGKPLSGVTVWVSAGPGRDGSTPAIARGTTDERGRLSVLIPDDVPRPGSGLEMLSVWAYRPGDAPGRIHVTLSSEARSEDVRITLPPAQRRRLTFLRPDGKPLVGAIVKPSAMAPSSEPIVRFYLNVPDALASQLALRTDQDGKVEIPYLGTNDAPLLTINTAILGTQVVQLQPNRDKPITLRAAGRVTGRVVADDPAAVKGLDVRLGTQFESKDTAGMASTRTDAEGRFVVAAMAEGTMSFMVSGTPGSPYRAGQESLRPIIAGQENHLEIRLTRAVRARGVVRERGTNKPIPRVGVVVGGQYQIEVAWSDAQGRFEEYVLPGKIGLGVYPWLSPRPFFPTSAQPINEVDIPANAPEFTLPPIDLARGDTLTGKVVDTANSPVPGARIDATLVIQQGIEGEKLTTVAGPDGTFRFQSLDPARIGLKLEASTPDARTEKPLDVSPAIHSPVTLTIGSGNLVSLAGRVVDRMGRPVPGAEIQFWSQVGEYAEQVRLVVSDAPIRTSALGQYQTPRRLRIDERYKVKASGPGLSTDWADWMRFQPGQAASFPDLVIDTPRPIIGRVVDKEGRPVAGAEVRLVSDQAERPHARSDDHGAFHIDLPPIGPIVLLADARGFRFQGQLVPPTADAVTMVLARAGEPPIGLLGGPTQVLPATESLRVALKVLDPDIQHARTVSCGGMEYHTLQLLARLDPNQAIEIAEKAKFSEPMMREGVRATAARNMLKESADEALALVESLSDPIGRTNGYRQASDVLPASARDRKLFLLTQGLVHAQGIKDPALRLIFLGQIAGRLFELGEKDRASKILRDGQAVAKELSTAALAGFGRGAFAEDLARIDVPAALELVRGLTDEHEFDRHHGNIAQRLAPAQPAEAERVWQLLKQPIMRDGYAVRVCYAMAPGDLPRARGIAAKITDPYTRAYALGQMALALSGRDKAGASQLLEEALGSLAAIAAQEKETYLNTQGAASTAATLLEVVERIDRDRVPEFLWRALALRGRRLEIERDEIGRLGTDAVIAMLVNPYDHAIAQALLEPILARLPRLIAGGDSYFPDPLFAAPAIVDPRRAIALVEALPARQGASRRQGWTKQRQLVARLIASRGEDRRHLMQQMTGFWRPDSYDLVDDD